MQVKNIVIDIIVNKFIYRRNIGKGIRLDLKGEGDVWLTVLSKHPIFVQAHYLDMLTEREERDHAHKFLQYTTVKVNLNFKNSILLFYIFRYLICKNAMNVGSEIIWKEI